MLFGSACRGPELATNFHNFEFFGGSTNQYIGHSEKWNCLAATYSLLLSHITVEIFPTEDLDIVCSAVYRETNPSRHQKTIHYSQSEKHFASIAAISPHPFNEKENY